MQSVWALKGLLVVGALFVSPAAAENNPAVRAMMEQSGMVEQAANLREAVRLGARQLAQEDPIISRDAAEAFAEIAAEAFDGERLLEELETVLADTLSEAEITAFADFYATPLGTHIKAAEVAAISGEAMARTEAREVELRAELERDPERLAIARRVDELLHLSEVGASVVLVLLEAVSRGAAENLDRGMAWETPAELESEPLPEHAVLVQSLREGMLADFAETYREVLLKDLRTYVEFLETDAARATHAAIAVATTHFLEAAGRDFGRGIAAYLQQKKI